MKGLEHIPSGEQTCSTVARQSDTCLLSFSMGKDAIGSWLQCRRFFKRVVAFYLYAAPGIQFVERGLRYYEDYFGQHIYRLPHPSLYRMLREHIFQPPGRIRLLQATSLEKFNYKDIEDSLRTDLNLGPEVYSATGVRANDSARRALVIRRYGTINHNKHKFYPIWDWDKDRLIKEITAAGVKLPVDYQMFPRSWDGINAQYLVPIKQRFPDDYERILKWFPLADLELFRIECAKEKV